MLTFYLKIIYLKRKAQSCNMEIHKNILYFHLFFILNYCELFYFFVLLRILKIKIKVKTFLQRNLKLYTN